LPCACRNAHVAVQFEFTAHAAWFAERFGEAQADYSLSVGQAHTE